MKLFNKDNDPMSSLSHFIGLILAIVALPIMLVQAVKFGTVWHIIGYSIFGASMILLYLSSAIYHIIPRQHFLRNIFKKLDHSFIFVLIAGTYTPICLTVLYQSRGFTLLTIIWSITLVGILIKIFEIKIKGYLSALLYLLAGWIMIIFIGPLVEIMNNTGVWWLFLGGVFYTIGTIFFGFEKIWPRTKWFGWHEAFHIFVLAGSFSHFWLMLEILK